MATPRNPYVCIGDSLLDEPWPFEIKAVLVMLSCHMHSRWRSDRRLSLRDVASSHPISVPDLLKITGKGRRDIALKSLRSLAEVASMSIRSEGEVVWIEWPKWAEYNETHSRDRAGERPVTSPSSSASSSASSSEQDLCLSKTRDIEPAVAGSVPRLVNLLSREEGSLEEKSAWAIEYEPILVAESEAEHPRDARARSAKLRSLTLRYWRAHRRRNGKSKEPDALARWAERTS